MLSLARTGLAGRVGERGKALVEEADSVYRRFLFAQGVAGACILLALQLGIRWCFLGCMPWPWENEWFMPPSRVALPILAALCAAASSDLRWVAGRWWESEFVLTCMLLREANTPTAAAPAAPAPPPAAAAGDVS
jgi:hypothetical protein